MRLAVAEPGQRLRRRVAMLLTIAMFALVAASMDHAAAQAAPADRWTFFVWMAADNDLEPQGIEDMKEMEIGIPEEGIETIVFVDRFTPSNKRFSESRRPRSIATRVSSMILTDDWQDPVIDGRSVGRASDAPADARG